jgi:subtilisin family serine protease
MRDKAHFFLLPKLFCLALTASAKTHPLRRPEHRFSPKTCLAALAVVMLVGPALAQPAPTLAPLRNDKARHIIPEQYIVVFKAKTARDTVQSTADTVKKLGGKILFTYTSALLGFNAKIPPAALPAVRAVPEVDYVEADREMKIQTLQPPTPNSAPSDGLRRIARRLLQLSPQPPLVSFYSYSETGAGVNVYVIDSGIDITHSDFGGRAHWEAGSDLSGLTPANTDCAGHGTHVAGIIGGSQYGVAKAVTLYAVRITDCMGGTSLGGGTAGVEWVTNNVKMPAVVNISLGADDSAPNASALNTAVTNLIAKGVTVVVAAGNDGDNACGYTPANVTAAITVGTTDPNTDQRDPNSNVGSCVKLFAPGVNIVSAFPNIALPPLSTCTILSTAAHAGSAKCTGSSEAAPHVAGVAARYLQNNPNASPADVWNAIHAADDVSTTAMWPGVFDAGMGSPNELLHWGSLNNGLNDGDPHITTVDGIHYDFQGAGEFVSLRDGNGLEIQTRQTPVATAPPDKNPYTGLATCVSLNTAVAAHVGSHRVTYEPDFSGVPDAKNLQLRVDGVLTTPPATGLSLGPGSRVLPSAGGMIEIDFPDGTNLTVTPLLWASQNKWHLDLSVFHTQASEGLMGAMAPGSWLPALPNGTSLGPMPQPMPAASHQRFVDLYQTFGNAWRVNDKTSLFDYAPGTSTATFTDASWPRENPPCVVPNSTPVKPLDPKVALRLCSDITAGNRKADCVFDTTITGEPGFAKAYLLGQRIEAGATTTTVNANKDPTLLAEAATFLATVRLTASGKTVTTGTVQFTLDGANAGGPIKLDAKGQATWQTSRLTAGNHQVAAVYTATTGSVFLASRSLDRPHAVVKDLATRN